VFIIQTQLNGTWSLLGKNKNMEVTYQSSNNSGWVDGGTTRDCVVSKPSGLSIGDLLILQFQQETNGLLPSFSGYNLLASQQQGTPGARMTNGVYVKIADSNDVAQSSFTFQADATSGAHCAALHRVSGGLSANIISSSGVTVNSASVSISGLTQETENNLLVFLVAGTDDPSTVSSYAIANSNPSWSEIFDISATLGDRHFMSAAHASRVPATATGNITCSVSESTSDTFVCLLSIRPSTGSFFNFIYN